MSHIIDRRIRDNKEVFRIYCTTTASYLTDELRGSAQLEDRLLKLELDDAYRAVVMAMGPLLTRLRASNVSIRETGKTPDDAEWREEGRGFPPEIIEPMFMLAPFPQAMSTAETEKALRAYTSFEVSSEILSWMGDAAIGAAIRVDTNHILIRVLPNGVTGL